VLVAPPRSYSAADCAFSLLVRVIAAQTEGAMMLKAGPIHIAAVMLHDLVWSHCLSIELGSCGAIRKVTKVPRTAIMASNQSDRVCDLRQSGSGAIARICVKSLYAIVEISNGGTSIVDKCYRSINEARSAWPEVIAPKPYHLTSSAIEENCTIHGDILSRRLTS
jgi:hypothetical protein